MTRKWPQKWLFNPNRDFKATSSGQKVTLGGHSRVTHFWGINCKEIHWQQGSWRCSHEVEGAAFVAAWQFGDNQSHRENRFKEQTFPTCNLLDFRSHQQGQDGGCDWTLQQQTSWSAELVRHEQSCAAWIGLLGACHRRWLLVVILPTQIERQESPTRHIVWKCSVNAWFKSSVFGNLAFCLSISRQLGQVLVVFHSVQSNLAWIRFDGMTVDLQSTWGQVQELDMQAVLTLLSLEMLDTISKVLLMDILIKLSVKVHVRECRLLLLFGRHGFPVYTGWKGGTTGEWWVRFSTSNVASTSMHMPCSLRPWYRQKYYSSDCSLSLSLFLGWPVSKPWFAPILQMTRHVERHKLLWNCGNNYVKDVLLEQQFLLRSRTSPHDPRPLWPCAMSLHYHYKRQ